MAIFIGFQEYDTSSFVPCKKANHSKKSSQNSSSSSTSWRSATKSASVRGRWASRNEKNHGFARQLSEFIEWDESGMILATILNSFT
jgi:hypothetical protein